jgi:uncharacterized protein DUF6788
MTRKQAIRKRDKLAARLSSASGVLRGSLLQRTLHHASGCLKGARGEGHPLSVLTVGYPGGKNRQVSLRPGQALQVRKALQRYRDFKQTLEALSELNQFLLRLDREESKSQEREAGLPPGAYSEISPMASSPRRWRISGNLGCGTPIKRSKMMPCC